MQHASGMTLAIDDEDRGALAAELTPGESLVWAGHPRRGLQFVRADAYLIPMSLIWCGFAVFWERMALIGSRAPGIFPLWGIPFLAYGIYVVVGRFVTDAIRRKRTTYGLTAKRVIIVGGIFSRDVQASRSPACERPRSPSDRTAQGRFRSANRRALAAGLPA